MYQENVKIEIKFKDVFDLKFVNLWEVISNILANVKCNNYL